MPEIAKGLILQDVWRTCNKVRAAIFRVGLNLWNYYRPLDPDQDNLISEAKFISILAGPLKGLIGLTDKEISDLADYFRIQDGRVLYGQFCELIHDSVPDFGKNKPLITGLEWEDPLHVNVLNTVEERRLNLIITQIAVLLSKRKLVLRPYFQDYELVSKNTGTVTLAHFGRILKFLGIVLAADEFCLLVKKFAKDGYTINYVAFVKAIEEIQDYFDSHGMLHLDESLLDQFPGRIITAELPKLPRPEVGTIHPSQVFERQSVFHPVLEPTKELMPRTEVIQRVQRHVLEQRIPICQFFKGFDLLNVGKVTVSQFRRGLDALCVSSLGKLYLSELEICDLIALYKDPNDLDRVCWKTFEDDINHVFTIRNLDKMPSLKVETPPEEIANLRRKGQRKWQCVDKDKREFCEEIMEKIRVKIQTRRLDFRYLFRDYDRHNHGHVTRSQMRRILKTIGILLSEEEEYAVEQRYNNDQGFNYTWFLDELELKPIAKPLYEELVIAKQKVNEEKSPKAPSADETNIVLILAKIKAKVVRERVKVSEFLRQFDWHNQLVILKSDFIRGLDQLRCNLSNAEVETITKVFHAPLRPNFIEYARFAETVEEAVFQGSLERAPLLVPVQHVPSEACSKTFLNFEERHLIEVAMDKLCKIYKPNLIDVFSDFDKEKIGTVTKNHLIRALSVRKMLDLLNSREIDVIHKCFSIERGGQLEIDYRAFLRALHLLKENKKTLPL